MKYLNLNFDFTKIEKLYGIIDETLNHYYFYYLRCLFSIFIDYMVPSLNYNPLYYF